MMDLQWLSASEVMQGYLSRKFSPLEYINVLLQQIETYDPLLHVFINIDPDLLRLQARIAGEELDAGLIRGPLHGIPIAIKDIIDVAGVPTTCHSALLLNNVAKKDAAIITRLRQSGAIILGKVATWEFAIGGPSYDLPFPPANNPWKKGHQPGGSSSGCGAGLAAGLFPLAIGTDTGGSIRHPAASCGVVGLKPTYDLIPRDGVFPLSYTLDHTGPMARTVKDLALLLDVAACHGPNPSNAYRGTPYSDHLPGNIKGVRIGYIRNFHERDMPAHPEVADALESAVSALRDCGADIHDITVPPLQDFAAVNRIILHCEAWSIHRKWLCSRPELYGQKSRRRLISGAFLSGEQYVRAQRRRKQLIEAINSKFCDFDILLCSNAMDPAGPLNEISTASAVNARQSRTPFNVTGHPAISLMSGLSKDGLPLSLQLIGKPLGEKVLLRVAAAYEAATQFHMLHPSLSDEWQP